MARIRSIKPEYWTSEQVMELSRDARLMFIGMWGFCDDAGIHPAKPKTLKAEVFPADDLTSDDVRRMVDECISIGLIDEYEVDGERYWMITGWHHQKVDQPTFKYPMPDGSVPEGAAKRRQTRIRSSNSSSVRRTESECSPNIQRTLDECSPPESSRVESSREEGSREKQAPATDVATLPDWMPEDAWKGFVAMRKKIKAPLTPDAVSLAVRELEKLMGDGHRPRAVLEQSTLNSWRGLFPIKSNATRGSGDRDSREAFNERENARAKAMLFGTEVDHAAQ
ncbi:hypothetical protein IAG25_35505 [Caballeronia sp. EK]|uniref:hypothetical protein n=1 Tax=Caballeronia sp. EK TaxID=2767469 RepID=UPI001656754A|nr:hypothetical protein [Caballeronia sp. EK]MBC8642114.1 hypothetical protein [Caballeronia sp. EK]